MRRPPRRQVGRALLLVAAAAVAGGLIGLGLAPIGWWPLPIVGVAMLAVLLRDRRAAPRAGLAGVCGIAQFAIGLHFALEFSLLGYFVLIVVEAVPMALAGAVTPVGRGRSFVLAAALVIAEWLRTSFPFGGVPPGGLALAELGGPFAGLARVGGPLLVVGATVLCGAGLARLLEGATPVTARLVGVGLVAAALLGAELATFAPDGGTVLRRVSVDLVQGGGVRGLNQLEVPAADVFAADLAVTETLTGPVDLVVLPEDALALPGPLARAPERQALAAEASRLGADLLVGVTETVGTTRFRNEILELAPNGTQVASFEKVHPVPFGEYVPARGFISHFADLADVPRDMVTGHGSGMIPTAFGRIALLISYETFFPGRGRSGVRAGGELLVTPTNTASYADQQVPAEELAASRLQAIAEGRSLVQAASVGYSALIDPRGDVLAETRLGQAGALRVTAGLRDGATLYERFGDLPVLVASLAALVGGWLCAASEARGDPLSRRRRAPATLRTGPFRGA